MSRLIDLYAMTPPAMIFLFGVLFIVYGFMLWKIMALYYGKSFTRAAEAMHEEYLKALEEIKSRYRGQGWRERT